MMQTPAYVVQQSLAGVFDQIENVIEALLAAIVGIGHDSCIMPAAEFGQTTEFVTQGGRAGVLSQCQIIPVHGQQQIMADEISLKDLTCPQVGQIITAQCCSVLTSTIRWFTRMIVVGSGGADFNKMPEARSADHLPEYAVRGWTATNIPHAEKKHTESWLRCLCGP